MRRLPIILAFALVLSACGGGGGNSALPATSPGGGVQAAAGSTPASLPHSYSIVDLGAKVQPAAINAKNDIAGTIAGSGPFIYRAGKFTKFAAGTHAVAINDNDLAVGDGFAYESNGNVVTLPTFNSATYSQALGVDNSGNIAGLTIQGGVAGCGGGFTLFSTTGPLNNIGYSSNTLAQSRGGKIVLDGYTKGGSGCSGTISPFYYPGLSAVPLPSGLTLDVNTSAVTGVNDAGDVIGYSQKGSSAGPTVTFFAHNGTANEIDPAGAYTQLESLGINNADWIVGFEAGVSAQKAIVWLNGTTTDLNTLLPAGCTGWVLTSATAVNDAGYITGVGTFNGVSHGFLLVPQH